MAKSRPITLRTLYWMLAFCTAALGILAALDILFVGRGIDAFRPTLTLPATVVAIGEETIATQLTKGGNRAARMEYRVRPRISYQFELNGQRYMSSRYFLHESPALADLPEQRQAPGSVASRMAPDAVVGKQLQVHVIPAAPELSYVDPGWNGLLDTLRFWAKSWLVFVLFAVVSWLLLLGWEKMANKLNGANHG